MRILQASFHFGSAGEVETTLVLAYIYCEPHRVTVEPVHSALEGTLPMKTLRRLIDEVGTDAYSALTARRLHDWSFDLAPIH